MTLWFALPTSNARPPSLDDSDDAQAKKATVTLAIVCIYAVDFALNAGTLSRVWKLFQWSMV